MRRPPPLPNQPGRPFDAPAARRFRTVLGMGPEHVAHDLRASYGLPYVTPDLVVAWEGGALTPTSPELTALAAALWCSPGDLIARPRTLREHRVARGMAPEDVARTIRLDLAAYLRMEETGDWRGTDRQASVLASLLGLSLPDFATVTGRDPKLADLLRGAVTTRWEAYVRPVVKLLPLDRRLLEITLQELYDDYQGRMVTTLSWDGGSIGLDRTGREFLDRILDHFWTRVSDRSPGAV